MCAIVCPQVDFVLHLILLKYNRAESAEGNISKPCALLICVYLKFVNQFKTREKMFVWGNITARSRNHCCRGKEIRITYSECESVASVTQHEIRMCLIMLSSVACLAEPHFFHSFS